MPSTDQGPFYISKAMTDVHVTEGTEPTVGRRIYHVDRSADWEDSYSTGSDQVTPLTVSTQIGRPTMSLWISHITPALLQLHIPRAHVSEPLGPFRLSNHCCAIIVGRGHCWE